MLIGARTQMMDGRMTLQEIFRFSRECGVQSLEYCCEDFGFQYRPESTEDYTIAHVKELTEQFGIRVSAIGNHLAFAQSDLYFEAIKKMIPKARRLDTDIFIISSNPKFGGPGHIKILEPELLGTYKKRLRTLLDIAEDCGVRLALEPEPPGFIPTTKDMLALIDEMNSDALCVNFDIGHAFLTDVDMLESVRALGKRIVHSHIENLIRGEHMHRLLNDGDVDLKACLAEMKKVGFDGAVAIDLYIYDYAKVLKQSVETLKALMQ